MAAILDAALGRIHAKGIFTGRVESGHLFHVHYTAALEATKGVTNLV